MDKKFTQRSHVSEIPICNLMSYFPTFTKDKAFDEITFVANEKEIRSKKKDDFALIENMLYVNVIKEMLSVFIGGLRKKKAFFRENGMMEISQNRFKGGNKSLERSNKKNKK